MKKLLVFIFLSIILVFNGCSSKKVVPNKDIKNITAVQNYSNEKFTEYLGTLVVKDYQITSASYATRGGDISKCVCIFEADVINKNDIKEKISYAYCIKINDNNEFIIIQEGVNVNLESCFEE